MTENMHTIEINGVKFDVDLRTATRVETLKVGSRVKVLKKSYSGWDVFPGVVVGFDPFKQLPTITVAYVASGTVSLLAYNEQSKETEIVAAYDDDKLELDRDWTIKALDRKIADAENALKVARETKDYFVSHFGAWYPSAVEDK
jgi:hypothetical protein